MEWSMSSCLFFAKSYQQNVLKKLITPFKIPWNTTKRIEKFKTMVLSLENTKVEIDI